MRKGAENDWGCLLCTSHPVKSCKCFGSVDAHNSGDNCNEEPLLLEKAWGYLKYPPYPKVIP